MFAQLQAPCGPSASVFGEKIQAVLLFPDNLFPPRAMDLLPGYSALVLVSPANPLGLSGAFAASLISVFR